MARNSRTIKPVMALSDQFLTSFAKLPKKIQTKTENFIARFRDNPHADGINLEKLKDTSAAIDDKLFSVRIDQQYRGILAHQQQTGIYLLLYVDKHDDAYDWAKNRRCTVNQHTNTIQVYVQDDHVEEQAPQARQFGQPVAEREYAKPQPAYFRPETETFQRRRTTGPSTQKRGYLDKTPVAAEYQALGYEDMRKLGVPDDYLGLMVTGVKTLGDLRAWSSYLPKDAMASLQLIAEGESKEEVLETARMAAQPDETAAAVVAGAGGDIDLEPQGELDDGDMRTALSSYGSQQSFVIINGDDDLHELLGTPLEHWRVFLHPSQRSIVNRTYHGPFRVSGGAGTGKTVVAMHRAKRLAQQLVNRRSSERIMFTTFSSNLAADIMENLRAICSTEELRRIEVTNLDKWVSQFLNVHGYQYSLAYDGNDRNGRNIVDECWNQAIERYGGDLAYPEVFYKTEWSEVVMAQDLGSLAEYLRAPRRGRGTRLSRQQKAAVWKVMEAYRSMMKENHQCDADMAMNMVAGLLRDDGEQYAHVIVDEAQDFGAPAYRLLRALVGEHDDDMFIAGDTRQRIYGKVVVLSHCGINIQGRSRRLKINYRTTEEIRSSAERVFDESNVHVADSVFKALESDAGDAVGGNGIVFDDLDGNDEAGNDSRSLMSGPRPLVRRFAGSPQEEEFVADWIAAQCGGACSADAGSNGDEDADSQSPSQLEPENICVVARTSRLRNHWQNVLDDRLPYGTYLLESGEPDRREVRGIRLATMHRVKGLEFDAVILVDVDDETCPPRYVLKNASDEKERMKLCKQERSLIYVAITRARKQAVVVGVG